MQRSAHAVDSSPIILALVLLAFAVAAAAHGVLIGEDALLRLLGLMALLALSFANGANDLPKTISTLAGSGASSYRQSLAIGTGATLVGGAITLVGAGALLELFSGGGITTTLAAVVPTVSVAIAVSAAGWVLLATRFGLPVSTTHALVGGSAGAALVAFGPAGINWGTLALAVVIPLVLGPLLALFAGGLLGTASRRLRGARADRGRQVLHILSAGGSSGARAWNDTPKIAGVGLVVLGLHAGEDLTFELFCLIGLVVAAMALGGLWAGWRVNQTLGFRLTTLTKESDPAANLTNAAMVSTASAFGLPLSTTHVSGAALVGASGVRDVRWSVARSILATWFVTVPGTALLAAASWVLIALIT